MDAAAFPPAPGLVPMCRVTCRVEPIVSLGAAPLGERRYVALLGGPVVGPELNGEVLPIGADWQINRGDGVLEIAAHYVIRTTDGALVEVHSDGLRHGPPEVLARLARGEAVDPSEYFFRTLIRFTTGAPAWAHLNRTMAIARGQRERDAVLLHYWRLT